LPSQATRRPICTRRTGRTPSRRSSRP
jgi:hypothetical protein